MPIRPQIDKKGECTKGKRRVACCWSWFYKTLKIKKKQINTRQKKLVNSGRAVIGIVHKKGQVRPQDEVTESLAAGRPRLPTQTSPVGMDMGRVLP